MKKLFYPFVVACLLIMACGCHYSQPVKEPAISRRTLNGLDSSTAAQWIKAFQDRNRKDLLPVGFTIWLSKNQLKNMDGLMETEANLKGKSRYHADGIRFYLVDNPSTPEAAKTNLQIVFVTTKLRDTAKIPDSIKGVLKAKGVKLSPHQDYYEHDESFTFLNTLSWGDAKYDYSEQNSGAPLYSSGASLYSNIAHLEDDCQAASCRWLPWDDARQWVENRTRAKDTINTKSEWFSECFLHFLFSYIDNPSNKLDGLRIYIGRGTLSSSSKRDCFILVGTKDGGLDSQGQTIHRDAEYCFEDYKNISCDLGCSIAKATEPTRNKPENAIVAVKKSPNTAAGGSKTIGLRKNAEVEPFGGGGGGGYNNGELCPPYCN